MSSVYESDLNASSKTDNHLRSADFFEAEAHPQGIYAPPPLHRQRPKARCAVKKLRTRYRRPGATRGSNLPGCPIVLLALLYSVFRLLLDALIIGRRSDASLRLELLVLRHQLRVLERQVKRPRWRSADRLTLAGLSRGLPRPTWFCLLASQGIILGSDLARLGGSRRSLIEVGGQGLQPQSTRRMTQRWIATLRWIALALPLLALAPTAAQAADFRRGQDVTIPAGTMISDDLYAFGSTVTVDGTIAGNLIAAGGNVKVTGTVERDVMVAGGTVDISGPVKGSVRMAGGNLTLSGPVTEDVLAAGGTLNLASGNTIGRDLVVGVGNLDLWGRVGRNLRARVTNLHLESGASVGGDLDYASDNTAQIDSGATVSGVVKHSPPNFTAQPTLAQRVTDAFIGWIRLVIGLFALGLLVLLPFGGFSRRASDAIGRAPLASLGLGLGMLIGVPILALIIFVLGLLVGGWPLSLAALALLAIATAVGYVLAALFVGRNGLRLLARREVHPLLGLLAGLVLLTAVGLIPILGGLVGLVAVVFGLGALTVTLFQSWRGSTLIAASAPSGPAAPGAPRPG
jgi:hypothetical protein